MTFYGKRHVIEASELFEERKVAALQVYDLIAGHAKVLTHVTSLQISRLAYDACVRLSDGQIAFALEDLSDLGLLEAHATFTAQGDDESQAEEVLYKELKRALAKGYFDHPDGRGRLTKKLEECCSFYFTLEERPKKIAVVASTTQHLGLELSLDEFIALCRDAGHKVPDDASITFTEAGSVHRLTVGDSIAIRWTTTSNKG